MARTLPDPECLALVFCNEVIEDKRTNNKSLIGIFNSICCLRFPAVHPRMFLFASLTSLRGKQGIHLVIARDTAEGEQELMKLQGEIQAQSPTDVIDIVFELNGLPIQEPGAHVARVLTPGGTVLMQRRFTAVQLQERTPS